ncbi:MAG TPA: dipeptidase [Acetobacteraceae bacterium]|jgi:acetylornithine deacetylase/succinyl-diaminopimelate desuccinylase-like protein|nr:dipeptidase [Acetobacteraceae bacterium]
MSAPSPAPSPGTVDTVLRHVDAGLDASRGRLFDLLRIPSVSAQPAHLPDCLRAAEWCRDQLAGLGFNVAVRPTAGQPAVVAHHDGPAGYTGPHVLFYGHYDVQPVDPLELWHSPPFEPQLVDGPHGKRFVARGAVDDKGQTMMFVEALRAWHDAGGGVPARVTLLIEGEEEVGSPSLEPFIAANKQELAADIALISDTGMWDIDTPAVSTRLRGMAYFEVTLKAANRDLHSGLFGGSALNPINALTRILGDLQDDNGRIQLPGFYDRVKPIANAQRTQWDALHFNEAAFLGGIGLSKPVGERGYSALERLWARPTADINGIWGGYTGPGSKTVIASEASAKVSFRLVADQDPDEVFAQFQRFINDRLPEGATVTFLTHSSSRGIEVNTDQPWVRAAQDVLAAEYGRPAVLMGCGGSVPVVNSLHRVLGIDTLLMGFGLDDDQIHSPNEKFEQRCFHKGIRSHARLLAKFAGG